MSQIEPADTIERIVGARRHATEHRARAVSLTKRVYVLHPEECVARGIDLRNCEYSEALDLGIDLGVWEQFQDEAVIVGISEEWDDLEPLSVVAEPPTSEAVRRG